MSHRSRLSTLASLLSRGIPIKVLILCWLLTMPAAVAQPSDLEIRGVSPQLWEEIRKLTSSDGATLDEFGFSVAISGDTVIVGARSNDDAGRDSGSAYIFDRNEGGGNNWGEVTKLTASDGAPSDQFGFSVAISGDTAIVGAHFDNAVSGSAYIFDRNEGGGNNWGEVTKITASDAAAGDNFGRSVGISGDTVVVGGPLNDDTVSNSGSAYIFDRNKGGGNNWGEVSKLNASDAASGDRFGEFVAINGDTVIVGAYMDDVAGNGSGSAYIFDRNEGGRSNWGEVTKLTASDAAAGDWFGIFVGISGDTVIVAAHGDDDAGSGSGSAYIFDRNEGGGDNWGEVTKLTSSDAAPGDNLGFSVGISGDTAVVGAYGDDDAGSGSGSAYIFDRNEGGEDNWGEVGKLISSDAAPDDHLGFSVGISGDTVVVGALFGDSSFSGSAYVFEDTLARIFVDGFESGDISAWSCSSGKHAQSRK